MPNPTAAQLTPEEKLALIGKLWDSMNDSEMTLTTAQQDELDRRLASLDQDLKQAADWPGLRDELLKRLA
ncbi:MAG: addiction module protein [Alphaproteobacteria bacterium]|nr:addiction module protein [Alphaproteobacteria bacterium]